MDAKQRVTLEDVAHEAGVSTMTVSRVVNNTGRISQATRQHVQQVITKLGYRPSRAARALVTNKNYMLGVIVPDITNPYFASIVKGIEDVTTESDYSVLLVNTNETRAREEAALQHLDDSTIDGLIVCSSRLPDEVLFPLLEMHQAVATLNRQTPEHLASCVKSRNRYGYRAYLAARYLAQHGHKYIGYIELRRSISAMQVEEYLGQLAGDGIQLAEEWCVTSLPTWEGGYNAAKELLTNHPELTAIVGGNDLVALGTIRAANDMGRRVPDDLAVTGGDDILLANQVTPPLTTFRVPTYEIGTMLARLLLRRIEGDLTYREYIFDEVFIERGSAP